MSDFAPHIQSARQKFAAPGSSHDRNIRILRILLPIAVGALAAILALAPFTNSGELSFVLDKNSVDVAKERMRVTEALYRGEDSNGRPFSLKAGSAVQKSSAEPVVQLTDLSARIMLNDGPAQIQAGKGRYDMDAENVKVDGSVQLQAAGGYSLSTRDVVIDLKDRMLTSGGAVSGRTNIGSFSANSIKADMDTRIIVLEGNAKLRINQGGLR